MKFGEWITYDGNGQPVGDDVMVEARFYDGSGGVGRAGVWSWEHVGFPEKYRLVLEEAKPDVKYNVPTGTNPKAAYGAAKLPMHLWPALATAYGVVALSNGAFKYGIANYKGTPVEMSTYLAALLRHAQSFIEGEEYDPVDGQPHLGGILANVAIILEARAVGMMIDDRPIAGGYLKEQAMLTEIFNKIKQMHADKNPFHYTRNNVEQGETNAKD